MATPSATQQKGARSVAQRGARAVKAVEPFDYASQWDTPDTEEITLRSGRKVVVQHPDMAILAKGGLIPNHLLPIVERFAIQGAVARISDLEVKITEDAAPGSALIKAAEVTEYMDFFAIAATVEPRLSFDGAEGTVKVTKLTKDERFDIWDWGVGLTASIARFSELAAGQADAVAAPPDGQDIRDAAEPVDRTDAA